jgi:hypothetical protein
MGDTDIAARRNTLIAWVVLIGAMISFAGSGPVFKYLQRSLGVAPILAGTWRNQCIGTN